MKKYLILFTSCLFFLSCSQNKKSGTGDNAGDTAKTSAKDTSFFPVTSFLQREILDLDSLPVTILETTTFNNKQSSAWLPAAKVKPKLQPFLSDIIDKNNLSSYFKETNFNDQSTDAITLMYDPKTALPDSFALRRWDVYINPDKNTLRRVYMVKRIKENNALTIQQLTWQSGKWAKIVTINNDNGNSSPVIKEIKWVWDLRE